MQSTGCDEGIFGSRKVSLPAIWIRYRNAIRFAAGQCPVHENIHSQHNVEFNIVTGWPVTT
jgi:hypothetical protein